MREKRVLTTIFSFNRKRFTGQERKSADERRN
jgi:hypothetical protein